MSQFQQPPQPTELRARMSMLRQMLQGDQSQRISGLMQTNPQFAQFMAQHKGQTIQDGFRQYGYDLDEVINLINMGS